jgi:hypothetical protein
MTVTQFIVHTTSVGYQDLLRIFLGEVSKKVSILLSVPSKARPDNSVNGVTRCSAKMKESGVSSEYDLHRYARARRKHSGSATGLSLDLRNKLPDDIIRGGETGSPPERPPFSLRDDALEYRFVLLGLCQR